MARDYTPLPFEFLEEMDGLTDEEYGRLIRAMQRYSIDGTPPEITGTERLFWKRCRNVIDRYNESYEKRNSANVENGKRGGRPRKQTEAPETPESEENPNNPMGFSETQNNQSDFPETQKRQTKTETKAKYNIITPLPPKGEGFEDFWNAYPRKVGKQAALKTWSKLRPSAELTKAIIAAVEYQRTCPQWQKDGGQYIPNPATWLNQGRWEDDLSAPAKAGYAADADDAALMAAMEGKRYER